eukprot:NODE_6715_length_852_cov_41.814815_g6117_i0.p1 GENE.NODE_6715_length_852_cov_41.814815_g6117_i0~~NODE_6715_length_852_cov_41.814815_g6117_i0.p1  ORF type:complete len:270 (+),score=39.65 NODE_6715_length_852_cov_41.814815_g6117_i0:55-810(+)
MGVYVYSCGILLSLAVTQYVQILAMKDYEKQIHRQRLEEPDLVMRPVVEIDDESNSEDCESNHSMLHGNDSQQDEDTGTWKKPLRFILILMSSILTVLGLCLPCYSSKQGIHVNKSEVQYNQDSYKVYSLWSTAIELIGERGDLGLVSLVVIFVVGVPVIKWLWIILNGLISMLGTKMPPFSHRVHFLQPWDMRDVFLVTLIILCSRIHTTISTLSKGYATMIMTPYHCAGFYCCAAAVVIDFVFYFTQKF